MSGDGQLRAFIERILRLKEEQDSLAADIREVYAEAKGSGFDKTAMGQLVSHLRKVEKVGADAVEEGQTVFDMYLDAYRRATGTAIATHTHEASQSYAEAQGGEHKIIDRIDSDGNRITVTVDDRIAEILGRVPHDPETGELTDTQEQPETATSSQHAGNTAKASAAGVSSAENDSDEISAPLSPSPETPQATADEEASPPAASSAPHSNPQEPNSSPAADTAGDVPPPPSPAALSEADVPAFLRPERRKSIADYRPNCLNPDACGATGLQHCYSCRKAVEAASETGVAA